MTHPHHDIINDGEGVRKAYIKAMGTICYDNTGLTYPIELNIDLETLVGLGLAFNEKWENQFGWSNQPSVLTFEYFQLDEWLLAMLHALGLRVAPHWED